jgi:pimeloyl-ACP methyl ester carboxylesterase
MRILPTIAAAVSLAAAQPGAAETLRTNGVELEYQVTGAGEPLLLLHGFGNCIEGSWGPLIPELAKSHRVIAVNLRGHGGSTNPGGSYTHSQTAEDIRGLLDALNIRTARAIGFSSGGMTLLHLATRHPDRLSKMVVVGATTHFGEQARAIMREVADRGLPPPVQQMFEQCATRGDAQVKELVRQFGAFKDSRTDMNFQPADLKKIKAETLIVHGDRDEFFPVAIPVGMYGAIPKGQLWIVPGGSHEPTAGASKAAFLETVGRFLAK